MRLLLEVVKVGQSVAKGLSDVLLFNRNKNMVICLSVGEYEAEMMALALDKTPLPKPVMFDSFADILFTFDIGVEFVLIDSFSEGIYGAKLFCHSQNECKAFDVRVSDAINLALRAGCPIYATEELIEQVGFDADILLQDQKDDTLAEPADHKADWDLQLLEELLQDAVTKEDYELAVLLRDKINELKQ